MGRKMVVLAVLLSASVLLAQSNLTSLNQEYKGRILTLRHSFRSNSQNYDARGNPIKPGKEGPWTLYGQLQIAEIKFNKDELEIRGRRIGLLNENGSLSDYGVGKSPLYLPDPIGSVATIRIQRSPGATPESVMGKVFAFTEQDLLAAVPDLWKDYVRSRVDPSSHGGQWEFTPGQAKEKRFSELSRAAHSGAGHNAPGITPPKPKYTPEPDYGGQIGRALVHGTDIFVATIDENGRVTAPAIISPIGLGVDESAAETIVKRWKFEPGQLNGKRVPTNMTLEVEYRRDR
ncbi:MAG TPA: energy transducer TonB [Candidatus Acidoferrales bacterium]|nr:energy transducer TonB [Candidatus Acidoferrales bacterium]